MKDSILAAATEEIRLHGSSFRMEDLARRLNISKRMKTFALKMKFWKEFYRKKPAIFMSSIRLF